MYYESSGHGASETDTRGGRVSGAVSSWTTAPDGRLPAITNGSMPVMSSKYTSRGAYEIKFLVDLATGRTVREWAHQHLQPDPHVSNDNGDGYLVSSLYLDTPEFQVFHRAAGFRQRKYRLRRYGDEALVWMELKRKQQGRVRKRRTSVADMELQPKLLSPLDETWEGGWFRRRLENFQLRPVCQVTYQRFACVGISPFGPLRLTLDTDLKFQRTDNWAVPSQPLTSDCLLPDQQILELKFRETIPNSFRDLIRDQRLVEGTFSKYRQSVEACVSLDQLLGEM